MPGPKTFEIDEQESGRYQGVIVGNDGLTPLAGATLSTLVLTLYVIKADGTDTLIRGPQQTILNANNVTVSAGGLITWLIQPADTTLVEVVPYERHIALFEWTWPAGAGKHEVVLIVRNLRRVT